MSMRCKNCAESFPTSQPFDLFELRRHQFVPNTSEGLTYSDTIEDGGLFCSRKCLGDYLKASDKSGLFDLGVMRKKLE